MCKIITTGLSSLIMVVASILALPVVCGADIPAPPVNQTVGTNDGIFNDIAEAECRVCHDDPGVTGSTPDADRHHLLYGGPLPEGACSINSTTCLSDANCDESICSSSGDGCTVDADCPSFGLGETCGEICVGETVVPDLVY